MIQNYNGYKVLQVFLNNPTKGFRLRELSRILKLGLPSVSNYVKLLEKDNLVFLKGIHDIKLYFANRDNNLFKAYKINDTRIKLEKCGLIEFLEEELFYPVIVLFDSHSIGEDREESDYDIAVFSEVKKELNLNKFEKKLGKSIHFFILNKSDVKDFKEKNIGFLTSIVNGTPLRGMIDFYLN